MHAQFSASQSVEIEVPQQPTPIQHYLRQPQRLVKAVADPGRTQQLGDRQFRLKMRPLSFLMLRVEPIVDLEIWPDADGTLHLKSIACEMRGVEYLNRRFTLNLVGRLCPYKKANLLYLRGKADLEVRVDLPPVLWFTPTPILEATGNGIVKSVLMTVKQRLMHHLISDYCRWAQAETEETIRSNPVSGALSTNSSLA